MVQNSGKRRRRRAKKRLSFQFFVRDRSVRVRLALEGLHSDVCFPAHFGSFALALKSGWKRKSAKQGLIMAHTRVHTHTHTGTGWPAVKLGQVQQLWWEEKTGQTGQIDCDVWEFTSCNQYPCTSTRANLSWVCRRPGRLHIYHSAREVDFWRFTLCDLGQRYSVPRHTRAALQESIQAVPWDAKDEQKHSVPFWKPPADSSPDFTAIQQQCFKTGGRRVHDRTVVVAVSNLSKASGNWCATACDLCCWLKPKQQSCNVWKCRNLY